MVDEYTGGLCSIERSDEEAAHITAPAEAIDEEENIGLIAWLNGERPEVVAADR